MFLLQLRLGLLLNELILVHDHFCDRAKTIGLFLDLRLVLLTGGDILGRLCHLRAPVVVLNEYFVNSGVLVKRGELLCFASGLFNPILLLLSQGFLHLALVVFLLLHLLQGPVYDARLPLPHVYPQPTDEASQEHQHK